MAPADDAQSYQHGRAPCLVRNRTPGIAEFFNSFTASSTETRSVWEKLQPVCRSHVRFTYTSLSGWAH